MILGLLVLQIKTSKYQMRRSPFSMFDVYHLINGGITHGGMCEDYLVSKIMCMIFSNSRSVGIEMKSLNFPLVEG